MTSLATITIREIREIDELTDASALFGDVWDADPPDSVVPASVLRAMSLAGNYVAGAYDGDQMVGAGAGFLGESGTAHGRHLHSHIVGVRPAAQGRAVGFALKQHQRTWCLDRGIDQVHWTFDPLVRRNGYFNVAKLGSRVVAYYPDFYGAMSDGINAGEETDRGLVVWDLTGERAQAASDGRPHAGVVADDPSVPLVLAPAANDALVINPSREACRKVLLPDDIVAVRRRDPALAREWRLALRDAFTSALADGLALDAVTRQGHYVFR